MADLKVRHLVVGAVATNCYIAENKKTKEALIIDPGDNAARIVQIIKEDGVVPVAVLLTHGHFDHAMAAQEVAEQYGIKIYAHETEKETLETPQINLSGMIGRTLTFHADCYVKDGDELYDECTRRNNLPCRLWRMGSTQIQIGRASCRERV